MRIKMRNLKLHRISSYAMVMLFSIYFSTPIWMLYNDYTPTNNSLIIIVLVIGLLLGTFAILSAIMSGLKIAKHSDWIKNKTHYRYKMIVVKIFIIMLALMLLAILLPSVTTFLNIKTNFVVISSDILMLVGVLIALTLPILLLLIVVFGIKLRKEIVKDIKSAIAKSEADKEDDDK